MPLLVGTHDIRKLRLLSIGATGLVESDKPLAARVQPGTRRFASRTNLQRGAVHGRRSYGHGHPRGDSDVGPFLLELIDHHLAGRLPYERMIETFPFERINEAIEAGESGRVVKPVLVMRTEWACAATKVKSWRSLANHCGNRSPG